MSPLVSPAQLAGLRAVGARGFDTEVIIMRTLQTETPFGSDDVWATVDIVDGWLREMSNTKVGETVYVLSSTGTYRLHLPVGTDIVSGDEVIVDDGTYSVQNVNTENTLKVFTTAQLRKVG